MCEKNRVYGGDVAVMAITEAMECLCVCAYFVFEYQIFYPATVAAGENYGLNK
jgi:hypothetical protein